jgi:hypothetical protein
MDTPERAPQEQWSEWEQRTEPPLRAEDAAQVLRSFRHEADSAALYRAMAKIECDPHLAEVCSRLAQVEERQGRARWPWANGSRSERIFMSCSAEAALRAEPGRRGP